MPTTVALEYCPDSSALFARIRDLPYSCWLDSGHPYSSQGRYDILTACPAKRFSTREHFTRIYQWNSHQQQDQLISISEDDPYQLVEEAVLSLSPKLDTELPFNGGAIGYFAYDLSRRTITLPEVATTVCDLPDMHVGIYHWAIIVDHQQQQSWLTYLPQCSEQLISQLKQRLVQAPAITTPFRCDKPEATLTEQDYKQALDAIDGYIHAGDCYQVNFTQRFTGNYKGDPFEAYLSLREAMASHYSAFLQMGQQAVLSLSPERFIRIKDGQVLTQPIKGTAPRGQTPQRDHELAKALEASEKNRAENLMIVDLMRNDLGKSCTPGSIRVPKLFDLESFPNVHHLVSSITGTLDGNSSSLSAFKHCFPGGSITGAPKRRAMQIIEELEPCRRSLYCGSIGYINSNGDLDTNIAIRSVLCDGKQLHCWGGGGIVADSDPGAEYRESLTKIEKILSTLAQFSPTKK